MAEPLLEVKGLKVRFATEDGVVRAVDGVDFQLERGKVLGIVGESGSGKSVTAMTLLGLTRGQNAAFEGEVIYKGQNLLTMPESGLRDVRGDEIAMIFQDPMTSLNPVYRIGFQIVEAIVAHESISKKQAKRRAIDLLKQVGIPNAAERIDTYPHELSGGMRQRVMIALALSCNPDIVIADEPTTALDVTIQAQILALLDNLRAEFDSAVILITHDLGVVASIAHDILVMYAGRVVEVGPQAGALLRPADAVHVGASGLDPAARPTQAGEAALDHGLAALADQRAARLQVSAPVPACVRPLHRGARAREPRRRARPSRSLLALARRQAQAQGRDDRAGRGKHRVSENNGNLLEVKGLKKYFPIHKGFTRRVVGNVHAVDDVSLSLAKGETLGLVGESGCGKSTLGRCIVRLLTPTSGEIVFDGRSTGQLRSRALRPLRREMQMIFQDPYASLNPRKRVGTIISDPMKIHGIGDRKERKRKVEELLETVGLSPEHYNRFPHEFSGGQRQRIGVARALALQPKLIVADEPVSALDVSIQAQVLNLLENLQTQFDLTYLFIAHDLAVVRHISDRIAVMYLGVIVEVSPAEALYDNPLHPYTISLLSAVPIPDPDVEAKRETILLPGELPSPVNPPAACRFHTRCPYVQPTRCTTEVPELRKLGDGHFVSCHWAEKIKAGAIEPIESTPLEAERQDAPVEAPPA